ncbi:MAG TPA: hypothetical protein VIF60_10830 [Burkholderiaceae bacterium]|jgi:hypothetical protein
MANDSMASGTGSLTTMKILWRRAPAWRLACMLALLGSLCFVFFPPQWKTETELPDGTFPAPSYTSKVEPTLLEPVAQAAPVSAQPAAAAGPASARPAPSNASAGPAALPAAAPAVAAEPPSPKTASLSLAPPGAANNGSGLDDALTGHLYSGTIAAAGYTVPLPDGKWALLANGRLTRKSGPPGVIFYLGKIEHKKLMGAAIIYALKDPSATIDAKTFSVSPGCARKTASYLVKTANDDDNALPNNCWYVDMYFAGDMQRWADKSFHMDNLTRAAAGDLAAKGVELPQDLPYVHFLFGEKTGLLYADFKFNPAAEGINSPVVPDFLDSDWAPGNIARHPEKVAFQAKLKAWGESFYPRMREAFKSGLPVAETGAPAAAASAP